MKFFRWGRKKDPPTFIQPTLHDDEFGVKISEWGTSDVKQQEQSWPLESGLPDFSPEALAGDYMVGSEAVAWEVDRLQETIRFVFSHEQEGLLAIGTFALDQLAGTVRQLKPPDFIPTDNYIDHQSCCNPNDSSVQLVLRELLHSSDDETTSFQQRSSTPTRKELPVFGDHNALSDLYPLITTKPIVLKHMTSKPSDPCNPNSGTDSPRDETLHVSASPEFDDEEFYSPGGVCGLFASRSVRRTKKFLGEKEIKRKKLPPEKRVGNKESSGVKKTEYRSRGLSSSLGRLWRSGCNGPPSTAEVTPEPGELITDSESQIIQVPGVPCIANVAQLEGRLPSQALQCSQKAGEPGGERKRRGHSFGKGTWACDQNGKWIRTDSEFVVLEM